MRSGFLQTNLPLSEANSQCTGDRRPPPVALATPASDLLLSRGVHLTSGTLANRYRTSSGFNSYSRSSKSSSQQPATAAADYLPTCAHSNDATDSRRAAFMSNARALFGPGSTVETGPLAFSGVMTKIATAFSAAQAYATMDKM